MQMKTLLALLLAGMMVLSLAACGGSTNDNSSVPSQESAASSEADASSEEDAGQEKKEESGEAGGSAQAVANADSSTPAGTVLLAMDAFRRVDILELTKYVGGADESDAAEMLAEEEFIEIYRKLNKNLEFEIVDETVNGDEAVVTVKITTFDGADLMEDLMGEIFRVALTGGGEIDEDAFFADYVAGLDADKFGTVTNVVTVELERSGDGWTMDGDDEFVSALLGNLDKAAEELAGSIMG